ncbi:13271_t:CDS:2 [Entrophospora sp. SA101]|nr:10234_t:CDS:2 [Entrophospora sp. SA101]CAJ0644904.1 13271_t:CDS:2 [Entrophospora sp. SA101]CAJ0907279.1 1480_t:CDS:2 [Entrophospora sp. SA101]
MEEIIRTNQELCKQLAEDDEIISEYKARIKSLERDLEYLEKEKKELSIQLKKTLKDVKYKEEALEDKILTLKARIKEITLHQRKMALNTPQPPAPNELIDLYDKVLDNNGHIDDYSNGDTQIWDILSAQNIRSMSRHTAHVEPLISKLLLLDVRMTGFAKYKFAGLLN